MWGPRALGMEPWLHFLMIVPMILIQAMKKLISSRYRGWGALSHVFPGKVGPSACESEMHFYQEKARERGKQAVNVSTYWSTNLTPGGTFHGHSARHSLQATEQFMDRMH